MGHSRGGGRTGWVCRVAGWLAAVSLGIGPPAGLAATWTWTGLGSNDNWSTTNNWRPSGIPSSDDATIVVFDGTTRLVPQQDFYSKFLFGGLIFTNTAASFSLGGDTNVAGLCGFKNWQFSGSYEPFIKVLTTNPVSIQGAFFSVDGTGAAPLTSVVEVASGGLLQVPNVCGGLGNVVTKRGSGTLRVYEPADGVRYALVDSSVAPEYRIEDGTLEMGTRTDRCFFGDARGTNWVASTKYVKCAYNLAIGDGAGGPTSAVLRILGTAVVLHANLAVAIQSDGLLDLGDSGWDTQNAPAQFLTINGGTLRAGNGIFCIRPSRVADLHGSARIEGRDATKFCIYEGATNNVDDTGLRAVWAGDTSLLSVGGNGGIVFNVSDKPADVVDLEVTGHLGGGGYGAHLVKRGAGTMSIRNLSHDVNRTNRVEEGALWINGVARPGADSAWAQWLVATNATLGGAGIISNASVVVQGGTLAPGGVAVGTLTVESNLTLEAGATLAFDLAGAGPDGNMQDQLVIQKGSLTGLSNAVLQINVHDQLNVDDKRFRIISGGGDLTGQSFRAVSLSGARAGRQALASIGNGYVDITIRNELAGTGIVVW